MLGSVSCRSEGWSSKTSDAERTMVPKRLRKKERLFVAPHEALGVSDQYSFSFDLGNAISGASSISLEVLLGSAVSPVFSAYEGRGPWCAAVLI